MSFVTQPYIGEITRIARQYEARLAQYETTILNQTGARYRVVARSLADDLDLLERKISARIAAGEDVPVSWLHREQRYRTMIQHVEANMSAYGESLYQDLNDNQVRIVNLAMRNAEATIDAAIGGVERSLYSFNRVPTQALENMYGALSDGSPLQALTASFGSDTQAIIENSLTSGLAKGLHPSQITTQILKDVENITAQRAATITRTEVYRSYREGNRATYEANPQTVDGWIWFAHLGGQTCAACLAMHGTEHPSDEPMGSHPNCRCTMLPKTKSWEELGFHGLEEFNVADEVGDAERWLANQDEKTQRLAFGNNKVWKGWSDHEFRLEDVVRRVDSPDWGTSRTISGYEGALLNKQIRIANRRREDALELGDPYAHLPEWQQNAKRAIDKHGATGGEREIREIGSHIRKEYEDQRVAFQSKLLELDSAVGKTQDEYVYRLQRMQRADADMADFRQRYGYDGYTGDAKKLNAALKKRLKEAEDELEKAGLDRIAANDARDAFFAKPPEKSPYHLLKELDPTYGTGDLQLSFMSSSDTKAAQVIKEMADTRLPKKWVDDFNASGRTIESRMETRAFFDAGAERHTINNYVEIHTELSSRQANIALHELTHFREFTSTRLRQLEQQFYARRTAGESLEHMGPGYESWEVTRKDKFLHSYMGKDYGGRAYELASMGVENTIGPTRMAYAVKMTDDTDFLDFILGILATGA